MLNIDDLKSKIEELSRDLDRKQKEYNALFEEMNTGFAFHKIILNKQGVVKDFVYLRINQEYERQTGLKSDDLLGRRGREVFPNLEDEWISIYGKVATSGKPARFELYLSDLDRYFDVNAYSPFKNFFVTTFYDITQKKKADILIAESEWKYRSVFENIREGMIFNEIIKDHKGKVTDYRILDVNKAYENIAGKKKAELIGKKATEVFGLSSDKLAKTWEKNNEFKHPVSLEYTDKHTKRIFKVSINLLDTNKFVSIYTDMTELIKAKNKAEESDNLKSAFLANMSHEIRTPLNGIIGYTDILPIEEDESKRSSYLNVIKNSAHQLLSIVNDIIDISKIEADTVIIHDDLINLPELFTEVTSLFQAEISEKGLYLSLNNYISPEETIISDRFKLTQVLSNLIKNAIKYTDEGSIELCIKKSHDRYLFCVKDTGIGIDKKYHKMIFDRFRQAKLEENVLRGGNGLGLAISKAYLEKLGGIIWVDSEPGKGSNFYFTLNIKN